MRGDVIYGSDVTDERQIPEARNSPPSICGSFNNSVIYANINDLAEPSVRNIPARGARSAPMTCKVSLSCDVTYDSNVIYASDVLYDVGPGSSQRAHFVRPALVRHAIHRQQKRHLCEKRHLCARCHLSGAPLTTSPRGRMLRSGERTVIYARTSSMRGGHLRAALPGRKVALHIEDKSVIYGGNVI